MVLTQHICHCIYYCRVNHALQVSFLCIIIRHSNTTMSIDILRVTQPRSDELPVTAFDNALSLSEGIDLCLALQHHLFHVSRILSKTEQDAPLQPC